MKEARFRFFGRVNDLLPPERHGVEFSCAFQGSLLTRDRGLLMRSGVLYGDDVRETDPRRQLAEVARRFGSGCLGHPGQRLPAL